MRDKAHKVAGGGPGSPPAGCHNVNASRPSGQRGKGHAASRPTGQEGKRWSNSRTSATAGHPRVDQPG